MKSLSVQSFGVFGTATGAPVNGSGTMESKILGGLGALTLKGNLANAFLSVTGNGAADFLAGRIGAVTIGGSLIGADATLVSKIASLTIKGLAIGTLAANDTTVFGIEAQSLGSITMGSAQQLLQTGPSNDLFPLRASLGFTLASDGTSDVRAFEV